jgi:uncharacterized membrane protein YjdF
MKLLHYFLGFNAFALAYWLFSSVLCSPDTLVTYYIGCCLIFSVLATTAVYNIIQGYKLQKSEY